MPRRFQFSLRRLMAIIGLVGMSLGSFAIAGNATDELATIGMLLCGTAFGGAAFGALFDRMLLFALISPAILFLTGLLVRVFNC